MDSSNGDLAKKRTSIHLRVPLGYKQVVLLCEYLMILNQLKKTTLVSNGA